MRIVTWNRDSHGLFDYESKDRDRVQQEFKSNTGALIQRGTHGGEVSLENPFSAKEKLQRLYMASECVDLLRVVKNPKTGDFEVSHGRSDDEETSLNRIWRVVGNKNEHLQQQPAAEEYFVSLNAHMRKFILLSAL